MHFTQQHIRTPVGTLVAKWSGEGLFSCEFLAADQVSREDTACRDSVLPGSDQERLSQSIERYFECGELFWELSNLDWHGVSSFQRRVQEACFGIPTGQTRTYGQLAALAGRANAARAVGGAMARNRWPILIPCHRVVGSSGKLTGYSGAGGIRTKRFLIDFEASKIGQQQVLLHE